MKLKIVGGTLDVEIMEGMNVEDVRVMLKKLAVADEQETVNNIKSSNKPKVSVNSSKSKMQDKLNAKSRMPI